MDSESQNNVNPIENATTSDHTANDEHKQQQPQSTSESSTDQSNIVDLIGNGQLVKKVSGNFFSYVFLVIGELRVVAARVN